MKKCMSLEESYEKLEIASKKLIELLAVIVESSDVNKINFVGIGNSIAAGWSAIDNNVNPWVNKLEPFIKNEAKKVGIDVDFVNFSLASDNSNKEIYDFIKLNPSLTDVKEKFIYSFDKWKKEFDNTLFQNYVDKDIAVSFYKDSNTKLKDYYNNDSLTITSVFSSTGKILEDITSLFDKQKFNNVIKSEMYYLKMIDLYIKLLSNKSIVINGNFPHISNKYLSFLNNIIDNFNRSISDVCVNNHNIEYFDNIYLDFAMKYNNKIKFDNHPSIAWQYTSLYYYLMFVIRVLSENTYNKKIEVDKSKQKVLR